MIARHLRTLCALCALLLAAGCASTPSTLYAWGQYEPLVYASYASPGKIPAGEQLALLQQDLDEAAASGKRVPPGVRAYMGYLLAEEGKPDAARTQFLAEKVAFPESAVFMDRLIEGIGGTP